MPATFSFTHPAYDAVIVGARCAGASTALLLARAGLRVLLVDRGAPETDTVSTHALMRGAVLQLDRWGLLGVIEAADTPAIERTVFHYGAEVVPVEIAPRGGARGLYAPRRTLLDAALVAAAREAGAEVRHGVLLEDLVYGRDGRVRGLVLSDRRGQLAHVTAGVVVGADGRKSTVAERVGAPVERLGQHATAYLYAYFEDLPRSEYHWYWAPRYAAGAIPTGEGLANVFVAVRPDELTRALSGGVEPAFRSLLARAAPDLAAELEGRAPASRMVRFSGALGQVRRAAGDGWALVGDASHFKDPITAHGITDALRDAELLADAIVRGGDALRTYGETRDALSSRHFELTDAVASLGWELEVLPALHKALSREMAQEVAFMQERFGGAGAGAGAGARAGAAVGRRGDFAQRSRGPRAGQGWV